MDSLNVYLSSPIAFHGSRCVSASELEERFGKPAGSIEKLCGITNRFEFCDGEDLVSCGANVVRQALAAGDIAVESITGIIAAADATAPTFLPSLAVSVAQRLAISGVQATTLQVGCNGGLQALELALNSIRSRALDGFDSTYVILVGDHTSVINDPSNWSTSIFFSDCVAALVVSSRHSRGWAFTLSLARTTILGGDGFDAIHLANPYFAGPTALAERLTIAGANVFRFAVTVLDVVCNLLEEDSFRATDYLIPHQGNLRMLRKMVGQRGLRSEQVYMSGIAKTGNTAAASVFFGLRDLLMTTQVREFSRVLLIGFGAEKQVGVAVLQPIA